MTDSAKFCCGASWVCVVHRLHCRGWGCVVCGLLRRSHRMLLVALAVSLLHVAVDARAGESEAGGAVSATSLIIFLFLGSDPWHSE